LAQGIVGVFEENDCSICQRSTDRGCVVPEHDCYVGNSSRPYDIDGVAQ
jgi:hypothetical protein